MACSMEPVIEVVPEVVAEQMEGAEEVMAQEENQHQANDQAEVMEEELEKLYE